MMAKKVHLSTPHLSAAFDTFSLSEVLKFTLSLSSIEMHVAVTSLSVLRAAGT